MSTSSRIRTTLATIAAVTTLTTLSTASTEATVAAGRSDTSGPAVSTAHVDFIDRITHRKEQMSQARLSFLR